MTERHPCPCCGHRTLDQAPPGSMSICPVCYWEDTSPEDEMWSRSNGITLREAQRGYARMGVCAESWLEDVRSPTAAEARDPDWKSLDEAEIVERAEVLAALRAAFGDLVRGHGMRIYEAELADDYGLETPLAATRRNDTYQRFWEVPDDAIARHAWSLSFFDPPGLRFHIPAYMSFALREPDVPSDSPDATVYALDLRGGALRDWQLTRFAAFNDDQASAIARFLRFCVRHVPYIASNAQHALDAYWSARAGA